jgi:hypothetical protein
MILFPDPSLPRLSRPWTRFVESRLETVAQAQARSAQQNDNTNGDQNNSLNALVARSPISAGDTADVGANNTGTANLITWFAAGTVGGPEIVVNSIFSACIVIFGATLYNTAGTTNIAESILGLRIDAGTPDDARIIAVSSDQPSGGGANQAGSMTVLIPLVPETPTTIALAYGTRKRTSTSVGQARFFNRFITVIPVVTP